MSTSQVDSRFLLAKCLIRKFPLARVDEADSLAAAVALAELRTYTAMIGHRTHETPGIELVVALRGLGPHAAVVMVSGSDRTAAALAAGADAFLLYDEWLRLGTVVQAAIARRSALTPVPPVPSERHRPATPDAD